MSKCGCVDEIARLKLRLESKDTIIAALRRQVELMEENERILLRRDIHEGRAGLDGHGPGYD